MTPSPVAPLPRHYHSPNSDQNAISVPMVWTVSLKQIASRGELTALVLAVESAINDECCQSADVFADARIF